MFYHLEVMKTMIRKLWIRNALHTFHLSAYLCFIDHVWMLLMLGNLEEIDLLKTSSKFFPSSNIQLLPPVFSFFLWRHWFFILNCNALRKNTLEHICHILACFQFSNLHFLPKKKSKRSFCKNVKFFSAFHLWSNLQLEFNLLATVAVKSLFQNRKYTKMFQNRP